VSLSHLFVLFVLQHPTGAIVGRLVDRDSRAPVSGARVALVGTQQSTASDAEGRFRHDGLVPGTYLVQVHAMGYAVASWVIKLAEGEVRSEEVELEPSAVPLDAVTVEGRPSERAGRYEEFERRRASGRGYFLAGDEIKRANARTLADLLRNVPGLRIACRGIAGCSVRMARAARACAPDFVIDGFAATYSTTLDMPPVGIVGIEIYRTVSETPIEFLRTDNQCGTIVIWTRSGPDDR
jgi:hypothetical protein